VIRRRTFALAAIALLLLAGCESSQDRSARLARAAVATKHEKGVVVTARSPDVEVLKTALVEDRYGTAAAVQLRFTGARAQAALPISFELRDGAGKKAYGNDLPGLAASLTHVPLLRPGERVWWVDDQLQVKGAKRVEARVGRATATAPAAGPRLIPTALRLEHDTSGAYSAGRLHNRSAIEQNQVTIYAVAERDGRVVAAGRAGIERVKARRSAPFRIFWIGDPKGAALRIFAPPTVLTKEAP
jgi:hypothetical protein